MSIKIPGLMKIKNSFGDRIKQLFVKEQNIDETLDHLEEILIASDMGVDTTLTVLEGLRGEMKKKKLKSYGDVQKEMKRIIDALIPQKPLALNDSGLNILFIVGVNGTGKTTTIAKLSHFYKQQNRSLMIAACDTFRAAAVEQLSIWAQRVDVPIVKHSDEANPGTVLYEAIDRAIAKSVNLLIVDTAGRFHNRANLMAEIEKLNRILEKKSLEYSIARKNLLVLDAGTGQNAFVQAEMFHKAIHVDGICLSKMDSTSKGGIVIALGHKLQLPIQFMGMGENVTDLVEFDKSAFVDSLFEE